MKLKTLLSAFRSPRPAAFGPVAPESGFYAVGDIHGRLDLLDRVLADLPDDLPVVCVGDYIDRGEDGAGVLRRLQARPDIIALRGNHEDMLLGFLDAPQEKGARWIRNGGLQTLASFGVTGITQTTNGIDLKIAADALRRAMGPALIDWMRMLPLMHQSGNVTVVHAGADPALPLDQQDHRTLTWGHRDFLTTPRRDGHWVVHGHTIVDQASATEGRIAIDTGAYATGRLTVARVTPGDVSFEST
ncbi:metallophosphoesterase family protein [Marinovum sp.]|uniref:metallophosphoesterase family protein n=1 Tax=Marinovum sp. TaxID=2024839 RepID=UPI002B270106|nr:metallophosphoesterase family protein [Marinovum sp.]